MRNPRPLLAALALVGSAFALPGCAESGPYLYRPTEHATAVLADSGLPAALYPVPADHPQGEVKIATLGVRKTRGEEARRHLVVRMVVRNNSDAPWYVDVTRQVAWLPAGGSLAPDQVYGADQGNARLATVPPRQQRTLDLLYPLAGDTRVPTFQLAWSVSTPATYVTERTDFRREALESPVYAGYAPYPSWYYSDWYYPPGLYGPGYYGPAWGTTVIVGGPGYGRGYGYGYGRGYGWDRVAPPPPAVGGAPMRGFGSPGMGMGRPSAPAMGRPSAPMMHVAPPPPARR